MIMTTTGDTPKVGTSQKPAKPRNRASVACTQCRIRRTKCVVGDGQTECDQCRRNETECVLRVNDERKRPTSKAYTNSLSQRIELLEGMLKQVGETPPPACHPPRTTRSHSQPRDNVEKPTNKATKVPSALLPDSSSSCESTESGDDASQRINQLPDLLEHGLYQTDGQVRRPSQLLERSQRSSNSPISSVGSKEKGIVDRILSTSGHLSYDSASGRLRYFGPSTNFHVYADLNLATTRTESREQNKRTDRIIRALPPDTYDYLMDLYWSSYNSVLHVVHRKAFEEDKESGGTQNYSGFLNICLLAMGYRFADPNRPETQKIGVWDRESDLHREAKYLFEYELEKPGGIPSVQALLILGDLECGVGRDNTGWMIGGMACRLGFDLGLNLDTTQLGLTEQEVQIRHMVLWACAVYDKYWALFLGRPTSIKTSDLAVSQLTGQFALLGTSQPSGAAKSLETQIYSALLNLMDLATKITERVDTRSDDQRTDASAYLAVAAVDRDLNTWYRRLPAQLKWSPANIETAPFSFFLLHQQFHCALILLHRPLAQYQAVAMGADGQLREVGDEAPNVDHYSTLSRTICFENAIRVARIFQIHRKRFDTRQIFVTGIQHAGTAATALIAAITQIRDSDERVRPLQHLRILADALKAMSPTYQPAERMFNVLEDVLIEAGWDLQQLPELSDESLRPSVPARRATSSDVTVSAAKRRQLFAPGENKMLFGDPFSLHGSQPRSESFSVVTQPSHISNTFSTSSAVRPESMVWVDSSPGNAMFLGEGDKMDFLGSSDQQTMDDLDAFADFDLPPSGKQDNLEGQIHDPWRGSYVWQIGAE